MNAEPDHGYGPSGRFNTTHWSVVLSAGDERSAAGATALEKLCQAYWRPLYFFAARKGHNDADAKDLTQQFFLTLLQRKDFSGLNPARGRFRTFLLTAFTHFLANEYDRAHALKRGGRQAVLSLDIVPEDQIKQFESASDCFPGEMFDRQWAMSILARALERLKADYSLREKSGQFELLKPLLTADGAAVEYAALAAKLAVAPSSVAVMVHRFRQQYRDHVREEVAQTVASPSELEEELRHLFHALGR